ncbi:MAG: prepilin peptidase [Candidatus Berkelbacteria bacterium]|nr:prepilin peptidase [Candidatus Berkelbacteria bacterium]
MPINLIILFIIIFGLIFGSFLSVDKNRLEDPKSIIIGRSQCPKCHHKLGFWVLIPLFSFLFLRGRCRYCAKKISWQYPIFEIISAILALAVYLKFGLSFSSFVLFLSLSALLVACWLDAENQEVELPVLIVGIILALIWYFLRSTGLTHLISLLYAISAAVVIPFLLYLISREKWMGLGDSFFAAWIAILSGFPAAVVSVFSAFMLGAIFGIIKMSISSQKRSKSQIAFGPFLAIGGMIGLFWGEKIINLYLKIFGL